MPSDSTRPLVFISYAHKDEPDPPEDPAAGKIRWLSFVMDFLRPGVEGRRYEVWIDEVMPIGADWNPEIEAKLRACDIFVLLVSTRSTGSDYVRNKELPIIRERQRSDEAVHFCPLLIDWTPDAGPRARQRQKHPPTQRPAVVQSQPKRTQPCR